MEHERPDEAEHGRRRQPPLVAPNARPADDVRISSRRETRLSEDEALEIATDAYVYAYPLVLMELTRRVATNVAEAGNHRAPMNQFVHAGAFLDPLTSVARANTDTLYSTLWFDVSREPLVISVPESHGRYCLLPIFDMWTVVFASPGTRTTGSDAYRFAIVGSRWEGTLPDDVEEIRSPTDQGWIAGRTQTNGRQDYGAVHEFQRGLSATPLSALDAGDGAPIGLVDFTLDSSPPSLQVERMDVATFWNTVAGASTANPAHADDYPMLHRMRRLGLVSRRGGAPSSSSAPTLAILDEGAKQGHQRIIEATMRLRRVVSGWAIPTSPVGTYGTDYLRRAAAALYGLGMNVAEDAFSALADVDADGRPLDSAARYVLHFERDEAPPVRAFWSLTMYNDRQAFAANPIDRYAIGNRDGLHLNSDGSLDLHLQRTSPGGDAERNWLPTPAEKPFSLVMRIYWPEQRAIDGRWSPPPLRRVG